MRRNDRAITDRDYMYDFIARAEICHLAMIDVTQNPAMPYVVPLNFGFLTATDDRPERFYFHSAREGRKLDLIRTYDRVCVQLDVKGELETGPLACDWGMKFASVIAEGRAYVVEDEAERRLGLDALMEHYDRLSGGKHPIKRDQNGQIVYEEKHLRATAVICVEVGIMTAKLKS